MSPRPGSIHRRPRRDSGAARLWAWARARRGVWTARDAAAAAGLSRGRARAIVRALARAGYLDCVRESEISGPGAGQAPAEWVMSEDGRALASPPVLIVDRKSGNIVGVRASGDGIEAEKLKRAIARAKLPIEEAARRCRRRPASGRARRNDRMSHERTPPW
ncbi:MAG TPA: hypothetical protein VH684_30090 [Xanthobacteraceae bacterium]